MKKFFEKKINIYLHSRFERELFFKAFFNVLYLNNLPL